MARTSCGFCEAATKITKEHVFGEWLGPLFGSDDKRNFVRNTLKRDDDLDTAWNTNRVDQRVGMACGPCNHGWMNDLETDVRRTITPAIKGFGPIEIDAQGQVVIATWALKTAMVSEFLQHSRMRYFRQEERRALMTDLIPSEDARVWLTRYVGRNDGVHALYALLMDAAGVARGRTCAFAIGQFAVQVFEERGSCEKPLGVRPGPWDKLLLEIWPPKVGGGPVFWPPPMATDRRGFNAVFHRFFAFGAKRRKHRPNGSA